MSNDWFPVVIHGHRQAIGGTTPMEDQFEVEWANGEVIWDKKSNLKTYRGFDELLSKYTGPLATLSTHDRGYKGPIKYVTNTQRKRKRTDDVDDAEDCVRCQGERFDHR